MQSRNELIGRSSVTCRGIAVRFPGESCHGCTPRVILRQYGPYCCGCLGLPAHPQVAVRNPAADQRRRSLAGVEPSGATVLTSVLTASNCLILSSFLFITPFRPKFVAFWLTVIINGVNPAESRASMVVASRGNQR